MHDVAIAIIFFLLGAAVGSFTNVLIWRLPRRESILFPGSHCPKCGAKIKFYDNIPIVSYIVLGGRCRNCGERISPRYPIVEALMAVSYLLIYLLTDPANILLIIQLAVLLPVFFALSWIDFEHYVIPDELTLSVAVAGVVFAGISGGFKGVGFAIIAGGVGAILFLVISVVGKKVFRKQALGEGDILLIGAVGTLVGVKGVFLVIFLSALLGAIFGIPFVLISRRKKPNSDSAVPFGPFICAATLITLIWGGKIIGWYLGLLQM